MTSNRPETSVPRTTSEPANGRTENSATTTKGSDVYTPNVIDLISPTGRTRFVVNSNIPPQFLQSDAVDSSQLIGSGASFTVTRQVIPPGPEHNKAVKYFTWGKVEKVVPAPKRPSYVVYKSARVRFRANGDPATPRDSQALLSVLTELHALLRPALLEHPNIITLIGLAWGSNYAEPQHRLPVLVVEYGDLGTLADVQSRYLSLTKEVKVAFCRGIASGIQALHAQSIVHGDLKPENIIICSDGNGKMIPKLADFGFAIMESSENGSRHIAGTRTWRAPETMGPVPIKKLKSTDIYSFGLVVWSIAAHVKDPFTLVLPSFDSQEKRFAEIDRLKMSDEILAVSQFENWFLPWMLRLLDGKKGLTKGVQQSNQSMDKLTLSLKQLATNYGNVATAARTSMHKAIESFPLYTRLSDQLFPRHLDSVFACTLIRAPESRNLEAAIKLLEDQDSDKSARPAGMALQTPESDEKTLPVTATRSFSQSDPQTIDWIKLGFKHHSFSWQSTRELEPAVQRFIANSISHDDDGWALLNFSACLINGYGIAPDAKRAIECMTESARKGHQLSRANLYRMSVVCGEPLHADVPVLDYLKQAALDGSRSALLDLCQLNPEEGRECRRLLRYGYGGIGAKWFTENEWLYGLSQGSFLSADFQIETLGSREELSKLVVNRRGDNIIHTAAAVGARGLLAPLLRDQTLNVNQQNAQGETALLCACRSGHADVVALLLNSGADASLQALNGESPLHWLSSFDPRVNPALVAGDLIDRGMAKVDAFTTERVSHSSNFKTVDVDFQMPGTPLSWAVHDNNVPAVAFLLSRGADPHWSQPNDISPLLWAAFYHHTECLKLMVEHLEKTKDLPTDKEGNKDFRFAVVFGPLVQHAVHAADNFSMVLRNGARCLNMMQSTLQYLQEKTKLVNFMIDSNDTLLHFAAREGHGEVIRFVLEHDWRVNEINLPAGRYGRTAILEAVRWNHVGRFRLLLQHGADPCILSASPHDESEAGLVWSALHLYADQGHNGDTQLVDELLATGVPVDGSRDYDIETPLSISIRRNAFHLADHLRAKGASLETTYRRSALITSLRMLTVLGHAIAFNGRYSFDGLQYLLRADANFMVCPERGLTALHLCALVPDGLTYHDGTPIKRADFDVMTNRAITVMILEHFHTPDRLNHRLLNIVPDVLLPKIEEETGDVAGTLEFFHENGETALHLAVEVGSLHVVELLINAGADKDLVCYNETLTFETATDIATRIWSERRPDVFQSLMKLLAD